MIATNHIIVIGDAMDLWSVAVVAGALMGLLSGFHWLARGSAERRRLESRVAALESALAQRRPDAGHTAPSGAP